jgi:hypothetical protein
MMRQALHRSPHFRRTLSVLAALALALRALIPTGFMLAPVDGHAQIVMCPAGLHQAGHAHHAGAAAGHAAGSAHAADQCPFALAGGPGLTGAASDLSDPHFFLLQPPRTVAFASVAISPPLRHHAPRGPPALA